MYKYVGGEGVGHFLNALR